MRARRDPGSRAAWLRSRGVPLLVFLALVVVYDGSRVVTSYDSRWTTLSALSLVRHGDFDLDEYEDMARQDLWYGTERVNGHLHSVYPLGPVLVAVPFVAVADLACRFLCPQDLDRLLRDRPGLHGRLERLIASVVVAAAAVVVYAIGRLRLAGIGPALVLTGVFALGTSAWSSASRGLWQHGPSMLLLALALYLFLRARDRPALVASVAPVLVGAYAMRPTNALSLGLLSVYVLRRHRAHAVRYLLWGALALGLFVALNLVVYGVPLSRYYRAAIGGLEPSQHFFAALLGTLVSPGRGLFVYSPVLLFALPGAVASLRGARRHELHAWLLAVVMLHWITISSFRSWWGGHSYGPRLFTDMLPYLVYFLIPVIDGMWPSDGGGPGPGARPRTGLIATGLFALAVAVSVLIHARGARNYAGEDWSATPVDVDVAPARLWDWRDPPFLRRKVMPPPGPG